MTNAIQVINENQFCLVNRGHKMTLQKEGERWVMYTVNPMVEAYRRGYAIPKYFDSLTDVESKYKSWRGISTLAGMAPEAAHC